MPPAPGRLQCHGARAERPRPERRGAHPARRRVPAVSVPRAPGPAVTTRGGAESGWPLRPWGWQSGPPLRDTVVLIQVQGKDGSGRKVKGEPADVHQAPCLRTPRLWARPFTFKSLGELYRGHWVSISGMYISITGKLLGGLNAAAARPGSGLWERGTATQA